MEQKEHLPMPERIQINDTDTGSFQASPGREFISIAKHNWMPINFYS
jgi:hypothetical protein